jgi:magnesium and cobalt exporter, CNNM family
MITFWLLRLIGVFLLVGANAFFVASEFALVSVRQTRVQQLVEARRIGARIVQRLHNRLDELLSAVQLGVTVTSLGLGWVGEATIALMIEPAFRRIPHTVIAAHIVAVTIAFVLITYLHVTLGELVPKTIALNRVERVALAVAAPMEVFMRVTRPFVVVMTRSARFVLRLFGIREVGQAGVHSPEELKLVVTSSSRLGFLPEFQEKMILRALDIGSVEVREIMVPRPDIFSLPADMPLQEALTKVVEEQHSRVPVYDPQRGPEHIIGLLYSKDLTRWMRLKLLLSSDPVAAARIGQMQVRQIMRDVLVVPETKPLPDLLSEFKHRKRHLAVVVDEYGSTAGVVTVEDVLEQLVGEIEDEFDIAPQPLSPGATTMVLDGSVPIRDLESQYQLSLPRDEGFETLAGFVLTELQKLPAAGESFSYDGRRYTVEEMDGHRIAKVRVEPTKESGDRARIG